MSASPSSWPNGFPPHHIFILQLKSVTFPSVQQSVVSAPQSSCLPFPIPSLNSAQTEIRVSTNQNSVFSPCSSVSFSPFSVSHSTDMVFRNTGILPSQLSSTLSCFSVFSSAPSHLRLIFSTDSVTFPTKFSSWLWRSRISSSTVC